MHSYEHCILKKERKKINQSASTKYQGEHKVRFKFGGKEEEKYKEI